MDATAGAMPGTNSNNDFDHGGKGPPVILLHGWPFHKKAFRKIAPELGEHFTWYAPNALGMNAAGIPKNADLSFSAHARRVLDFATSQGLQEFAILAHDTGGTIARLAAHMAPQRVTKLVLLNTEMPNHRPPFIPFYQKASYSPGNRQIQSWLLRQTWFQKSAMGFGGCFYDLKHIDAEFKDLFVNHWLESKSKYLGLMRYLQGLDFKDVDNLEKIHAELHTPVHFIWGKEDVTFPVALARQMAETMPTCVSFTEIERSCFLLYEERPMEVAAASLKALNA